MPRSAGVQFYKFVDKGLPYIVRKIQTCLHYNKKEEAIFVQSWV